MTRIFAIAALVALVACTQSPESSQSAGRDINVDKLMTVDGVTVWRFYDSGHYVYFTSRGDTHYVDGCGKNCTAHHDVPRVPQ